MRLGLPAVLLALALAPAASAGTPAAKVNLAAGEQLFRAQCGSCHRLAAAGTKGGVGPNLNYDALKYDVVTYMVDWGDSLMPGFGDRLTPAQIRDLSTFVVKATQ